MKKYFHMLIGLVISCSSFATIINVPADQPTIQAGIDLAIDGDTVLAQPGTYLENINYNGKNINVASHFFTTQDTIYILQTILEGVTDHDPVVTFMNGEDSTALLIGFSITGGNAYEGGGIKIKDSSPKLKNLFIHDNTAWWGGGISMENSCTQMLDVSICNNSAFNDHTGGSCNPTAGGGGVHCMNSSPLFLNVIISGNSAGSIVSGPAYGGGICLFSSNSILQNVIVRNNTAEPAYNCYGGGIYCGSPTVLSNVSITGNSAIYGGGVFVSSMDVFFDTLNRCNIYLNHAYHGNDIFSYTSNLEVVLDTFTVMSPTEYFASLIQNFNFDILHGISIVEPVEADLYVSPNGADTNSGLSENEPLKTIGHALSKIIADSLHPHIIHLLEGTYSQSINEEIFPLYLPDYVNIEGTPGNTVILDAEGNSMVMVLDSKMGVKVSGITIYGGSGGRCGGLYCKNTNLILENVGISNNSALAALCFVYSEPIIKNTIITENEGFGIQCFNSATQLTNVTVSANLLTSNEYFFGGGISCRKSPLEIVNSIFWNDSVPEICYATFYDTTSVTVTHSDIQGGPEGIIHYNAPLFWLEGNMDLDPLFAETSNYPFALSDESPCLNEGTPDTTGLFLPELDLAGNPRIYGGQIDMGAYENQSVSVFINQNLHTDQFKFASFPNPFKNELTITWNQTESAFTRIEIYNSVGRKVQDLIGRIIPSGNQEFSWITNHLLPGIYFIRLETGNKVVAKKIIKH